MRPGPVRYTEIGDAQIAYQVTGEGPIDFVYMIGTGSNFDMWWDYPPFAAMLERFASFSRLILFDRRGSGISDPLPEAGLATWEYYAEDLLAVLDAAGSERAAVMAAYDGGGVGMVFAATNPERVRALVLWNSFARSEIDDDYPIGHPPEASDTMNELLRSIWGTEELTRYLLPDHADDEDLVRWHGKLLRAACTPASYTKQNALLAGMDARWALPLIHAPVLVFNSSANPMIPVTMGQYIADHVPNGRFIEISDASLDVWSSKDAEQLLDVIEEFVTGVTPAARNDRVLASVLFTDIVGSTERASELGDARWKQLLENHDRTARSVLGSWRGELIKTTGDGILATFDGPGRAIQCALRLNEQLARYGIDIRAGVHFGEIEKRSSGDVGGVGVHVAARLLGHAGAGEIVCTRTAKELSLGSGVDFVERGTHTLKGVPEEWQLFAVRAS